MAIRVTFAPEEVAVLEADFRGASVRALPGFRRAVKETTRAVRDDWRANARATAGRHGKHYPRAITDEMKGTLTGEAGPQFGMLQGGMGRGFEFGSINQTSPHLDGTRAAMGQEGPFAARLAAAAIDAIT